MRIPPAEYLALDLEAHALLEDVPLRDVSVIDLPGVNHGRTIADVRRSMDRLRRNYPPHVRMLAGLRRILGRVFGWDGEMPWPAYASRLSEDQRARSLAPVGSADGPLRLLYEFPLEMVSEARNATVHAFSCMALRARSDGYRFYWAIYTENVSPLTPLYMAMIEPFRRFVIYPTILKGLRGAWLAQAAERADLASGETGPESAGRG